MTDIAIIGAAGVGKDTVFGELMKLSPTYRRASFADSVKRFVSAQFPQDFPHGGIQWDKAKQRPEVRKLLQDTGMAGRTLDPDLWVNLTSRLLDEDFGPDEVAVFTDARFENELQWITEDLGGIVVYLQRDEVDERSDEWRQHVSEQEWRRFVRTAELQFTGSWDPAVVARSIHEFNPTEGM